MDSAKISVFEQTDEVGLGSFLERKNGGALETKIGLVILSDLTNEALERKLADEELSGLLELADLTESDGTGFEAMRLLDSASGRGGFTGGLCGELLTRSLATGGLTSGLLGTSHWK